MNGNGSKWWLGVATAIIVGLASWNFYTVQTMQIAVAELEKTMAMMTETQTRETAAIQKASDTLTDLRIQLGPELRGK